jgi:hypothetical protein
MDIDAAIPKARLGRGDGDVHWACDIEADEFITRGRVRHINRPAIHGDCKSRRPHLRRHRRSLNARGGMNSRWKRKNGSEIDGESGHEQRTKSRQEDQPRQQSCNGTTLAPVKWATLQMPSPLNPFTHRHILAQLQLFAIGAALSLLRRKGFSRLRLAAKPLLQLLHAR